jgi:predicted glycogen debranching enzyme
MSRPDRPDPAVFVPGPETRGRALDLEWLETDGLGGFSSSTVALANTRCYHAILNPAVHPPLGRMVLWASIDERVIRADGDLWLSTHRYPGVVQPEGYRRLVRFEARPFPRWTYEVPGGRLVRELFLVHGLGDAILSYTWQGPEPLAFGVRPMLAFRDHHAVVRRTADGRVDQAAPDRLAISFRGDEPVLHLHAPGATYTPDSIWVLDEALPIETSRGLPDREDLWVPGEFALRLEPGRPAWIRAGITPDPASDYGDLRAREIQRREALRLDFLDTVPGLSALAGAADQFLVRRGEKDTVIAGYPWFTDWGRDTMIALPGLTLATGRPELARELILTFVSNMRDGLIPNRFPDEGEEPEYNTVDATLWLAVAIRHAWRATGDRGLLEEVLPALREALRRHRTGTRHGIHVTEDGLLAAGEPGVQLTWMDAKVDDWVVTPRHGRPVEIQALWFNFLKIGEEIETALGKNPEPWRKGADRVEAAFPVFWDAERGYLADVLRGDGSLDWSFRPNQLFALFLPYPLATPEQARSVLKLTREKLLTPRGLRSLDPADTEYEGHYGGNRRTRDAAYHQGTVWGWLHGPYLDAVLRYEGETGRTEARRVLAGWAEHLGEACLGQASEVFDGDAPHAPRGCPAQAWTVAELVRIARELA